MAVAELLSSSVPITNWYLAAAIAAVVIVIANVIRTHTGRPAVPNKAPQVYGSLPLFGAIDYWTKRFEFHLDGFRNTNSNAFTYFVGQKAVIAVRGAEARKIFFEHEKLDFGKGYEGLFGGGPPDLSNSEEGEDFPKFFIKRINVMVRRENLQRRMHHLTTDVRARLQDLIAAGDNTTNPFKSIYSIVFQLTVRMVSADEIAEDRAALDKLLHFYELVDSANTPAAVVFPSLPSWSKARRLYAGLRIYFMFKRLIDNRRKTGSTHDDPLQYLMDQGDDLLKVITVTMGALFSGVTNTGVNAAFVLTYLGQSPEWRTACRREVEEVAERYNKDTSKHLADRLADVPYSAWETEFPIIDTCLYESIRINSVSTAMRRNISRDPITIGDQVVPSGWYMTYHFGDTHYDPDVYPDPFKWNPGRYINTDGSPATGPGSAKETAGDVPYAFVGWGVGRHPCVGQRFAKLEQAVILAFWTAFIDDWETELPAGRQLVTDKNAMVSERPREEVRIRYKVSNREKLNGHSVESAA